MPSTYSTNLKIELMATGENSGTWGTVTNTNLGTALEQAVVGYGNPDFVTDANLTITLSDSNSLQAARALVLNVTSTASLTVTRELIVPTIQKQYIVQNNTSGSQSITVKTSAGTGVTIPNGKKMHVYVNGTDVVQMDDFALIFNVDNLTLDGNTLSSTNTNGNIVLAPNGNGDVQLDADTVRVGDSNVNVTITSNGTADLILNTNSGTNSGAITIQDGVDGNIVIAPNGNGQVQISNAALDLTTIEVTNIKAKDGTASMTLADSTGVVTFSANPVLNAGTANGVPYLNGSKVLTTGSALTFDGTNLGVNCTATNFGANYRTIETKGASATTSGVFRASSSDSSQKIDLYIDGGVGTLRTDSNHPLAFRINNAELMRLTDTGLKSSIAGTNADPVFSYTSDTNTGIFFPAADKLGFVAGGGSDDMVLTTTGLGIGTNAPAANLDIRATNPTALFSNSATRYGYVQWENTGSQLRIGTDGAFNIRFDTNASQKMLLDSSGNLGLGVTPSAWGSGKAIELGQVTGNALWGLGINSLYLTSNARWNGSNYVYTNDGAANLYGAGTGNGTFTWFNAPSGTVNTAVVAASTSYTVVALGTTTLGQWQASFSGLSAIPTLGQVLTSLASPVSPIPNGGLVTQNISFTQAMTLLANGNLGIGETNPGNKLTVKPSATSSGAFDVLTGSTNTDSIRLSGGGTLNTWLELRGYLGVKLYSDSTNTVTVDSSGNLGLGVTPSTVNTLSGFKSFEIGQLGNSIYAGNNQTLIGTNVKWDGTTAKYAQVAANYAATLYNQQGGAHQWFNAASGTAGNTISFIQAMTLDASGRLGIGPTSVEEKLHISAANPTNGVVQYVQNTSTSSQTGAKIKLDVGNVGTSGLGIPDGASNALAFFVGGMASGSERARITSGGNFLVGTDNAAENAGSGMKVLNTGGTVALVSSASDASQQGFEMYSTTAAAYRLYINYAGTINATSTTISAISDQRFKENIQDLDVGLDKIMALKPRKFDWKAGKGKDIKGDRGWIAQEFEQVFPDLIDEWRDPAPEGEEPYKAVRADLIPVLVKAIQELKAEFDAYKASHP